MLKWRAACHVGPARSVHRSKRAIKKTILATGNGRGIAACARLAAKEGYRIWINYRTDDAPAVRTDVVDEADVEPLFAQVDAARIARITMTNVAGRSARACSTGRGGRPRDATRDEAILDTVIAIPAQAGYERMTMDMVAVRARAGSVLP